MKKQRLMIALLATLGMGSALASTSSEYNIANGLLPVEKDQSISVLQPFQEIFRIFRFKKFITMMSKPNFHRLIMR